MKIYLMYNMSAMIHRKNPRKINESKYQVQFMTIKAHSKDDLTLWHYMDGPLQTLNADEESITFTRLFPGFNCSKPAVCAS